MVTLEHEPVAPIVGDDIYIYTGVYYGGIRFDNACATMQGKGLTGGGCNSKSLLRDKTLAQDRGTAKGRLER